MFKCILEYLAQGRQVRYQLAIYLHVAGIYNCAIKMCRQAYAGAAQKVLGPAEAYLGQVSAIPLELPYKAYLSRRRNLEPTRSLEASRDQEVEERSWCLGPLAAFWSRYHFLSTAFLVYVALVSGGLLSESLLSRLWGSRLSKPAHCYLLGRLVLHGSLPRAVALGGSLCLLAWRARRHRRGKLQRLKLNMVAFMLQDGALVEREQARLARHLVNHDWRRPSVSQYQLYLRHLLYHAVHFRGQQLSILRANRSPEARRQLAGFMAKCSLATLIGLVVLLGFVAALALPLLLSREAYLDRYPGCSLEHPHQDLHRWLALIADLLVNWFIWVELAALCCLALTFCYLVNEDFIYYWTRIKLVLSDLDCRLKLEWCTENGGESMKAQAAAGSSRHREQLEAEICILQARMIDFFVQLKEADQVVSDILTASVILWLAIFSSGTLYFLKNGLNSAALDLRLVQLVALMLLCTENLFLLRLRRALNQSYPLVCSITAYDCSRYKRRFARILDYWNPRLGSISWTLFHKQAFTATTSLAMLGWSLTLIIVAENFL